MGGRGLVEELASAADPCDALTVLAEPADEPPGAGAGRTAIVRTPGAVAAILGATSHRGPSNVDTARCLSPASFSRNLRCADQPSRVTSPRRWSTG